VLQKKYFKDITNGIEGDGKKPPRLMPDVKWQNIMSEEKDFISNRIEAVKKSIHFFSNELKPERERWVVNKLLDYIGVDRTKDEVRSSADEPIDVIFRDGCFQAKEILDKERKRTDEYKGFLEKAENAKKVEDLFEQFSRIDLKFDDVLVIVFDQVQKWTKKYPPEVRKTLDLLFYFNMQDVYIKFDGHEVPKVNIDHEDHKSWRSVSVVENECAFIIYADQYAPDFLKEGVGKILK